ncbi:MAG: NAD(P)H-hydrate dehydratase, partial [Solirubrobacteraceae bacterium]
AESWSDRVLDGSALVVDAILGTGATGPPRDTAADAIAAISRFAADGGHVIACDVPSGVDATTGETPGVAVRARTTVTFHAATPGLWIAPGKALAGRVRVADIGIPDDRGAAGRPAAWAGLLTDRLVAALPTRGASGTKFRSGHVVVVGGAPGMVGAPCLAARGAMRAGAGYVTLATPGELATAAAAHAPVEALAMTLPTDPTAAADAVLETLGRHDGTLVLGPGLGRSTAAFRLARALVGGAAGPLVVDADGLAAYAGDPEGLRHHGASVLTPHAGELARLLDRPGGAVAARRLHHAHDAAVRSDAIVVLKGDDTLVVAPDGRTAISPGGVPGLATAGTGDVLAGTVGALLARGTDGFVAAAAAVRLHALAGMLATEEHGADGVVAGDVAEALGRARRRAAAGSD